MEGDITCPENAGIVPRSVKAILEQLEASGAEFTIRVSFLELCKKYIFLNLLHRYLNYLLNYSFILLLLIYR